MYEIKVGRQTQGVFREYEDAARARRDNHFAGEVRRVDMRDRIARPVISSDYSLGRITPPRLKFSKFEL